ncbi:hypothetical protein IRB23M11_21030 [Alkalibacterium sp. m-11]|uniref:O-antigen ligase like membrane protein n=1 Tax=Alkalibacterium indicireducens TaxID=398758 RepID=A0ABN1AKG6_9LACT
MVKNLEYIQLESNQIKTSKREKIMFFLVLLDILFFPYITPLYSSLSMWVLIFWLPLNLNKLSKTKEVKMFFFALIFILASTIYSFRFSQSIITANITNTVILIYGFLYYFFFRLNFQKYEVNISSFLIGYLVLNAILGLVYYLSPQMYFNMRSFWTMSGNTIEVGSSLSIYRFTGILSDPNNFAVIINAITYFLIFNTDTKVNRKFIIVFLTGFLTVISMSTTGLIMFALLISFAVITKLSKVFLTRKIKKKNLLFGMVIISLLPFFLLLINEFFSSEIAVIAINRSESNSADSRIMIWQNLLSSKNMLNHLVLGDGGNVIINNRIFRPHNGHFHLIYSYGIITYFIFMYTFFRIRGNLSFSSLKKYLFLVPIFLGFTVNVGIYENRFINIMGLLVAAYATSKEK